MTEASHGLPLKRAMLEGAIGDGDGNGVRGRDTQSRALLTVGAGNDKGSQGTRDSREVEDVREAIRGAVNILSGLST